jgi:N-acetylmuramoyl-L-alanine amidase
MNPTVRYVTSPNEYMRRLAALAISLPLLWAQSDQPVRTVTAVRHWTLGDVTRVAVEVSAEFKYYTERLHNPDRVYFDILDSHPRVGQRPFFKESLNDQRVKQLRVAETTPGVTRIVLDLAGSLQVTTSQLANPDRLIIEVRAGAAPTGPTTPTTAPDTAEPAPPPPKPTPELPRPDLITPPSRQVKAIVAAPDLASAEMVVAEPSKNQLATTTAAKPEEADAAAAGGAADMPAHPAAGGSTGVAPASPPPDADKAAPRDPPTPFPAASPESPKPARRDSAAGTPAVTPPLPLDPAKTSRPASSASLLDTGKAARHTTGGDSSLIRELGLKISRVVIDPGHGGHDQGTQGAKGLLEKDLVLDVSKRVGKLVEDKMGAEVIYTRSDDTFIPLEARTALANEKKADLFLSIHANSSPVIRISGVETYYLNFAETKDAIDVAARENANAHESVFELRDLVQKITMHDKAEESREFANRMQTSLFAFSSHEISGSRNRGVKKAPFVVLIGAQMPSILAEIGFLSNPREEALLKRSDYRQRLADALFRGVQRYADSLSHFQVAQQTQNSH